MAGNDVSAANAALTSDGTTGGVVAVASTVAFRAGAQAWLSRQTFTLAYTARGTTAFSGTLTGGTSAATATIISDSRPGGTSGAGTLTLSGITGTFQNAETISGTAGSATESGTLQSTIAASMKCRITEITDSTHMKVRKIADDLAPDLVSGGIAGVRNLGDFAPNYGTTDISAFTTALGARIDTDRQLIYDEPRTAGD